MNERCRDTLVPPADARNRDPILAILREVLPSQGIVLEIASGSGEHAVHFAVGLPDLIWQPSDIDPFALKSIAAYRAGATLPNILAPLVCRLQHGRSLAQMRWCAST